MKLEWSVAALADLDRFAEFLHEHHPGLTRIVAAEILAKVRIIAENPGLGRPVGDSGLYRELVLIILNGRYVFRYGYDGKRLVMLRVFHSRETREM